MMTGFILAMARAAGEVAPLMITGVVKLAPQMPVDGVFPFFHLDRKFMHLGFHIYDVGFQSPNVEASKPMVFVTTLLLLAIVLAMTSVAIYLRNRMRNCISRGPFDGTSKRPSHECRVPSSRRGTFACTTARSSRCSTSPWIFRAIRSRR